MGFPQTFKIKSFVDAAWVDVINQYLKLYSLWAQNNGAVGSWIIEAADYQITLAQ
jgi:hypothetical protein